jgi:hypothetical protein
MYGSVDSEISVSYADTLYSDMGSGRWGLACAISELAED